MTAPLLAIRNLTVQFRGDSGWMTAIDDVSLDVDAGDCVGIVGESGSGKSVTALSILRLHARATTRMPSGTILYQAAGPAARAGVGHAADPRQRDRHDLPGPDVVAQSGADHRRPDFRDVAPAPGPRRGAAARKRVVELLDLVRIPDAARRADDYPHRLSGGMRQRVMIAMAIACKPAAADCRRADHRARRHHPGADPRTAARPARSSSMSVMLISHDLGVIAEFAQRVIVMYAGRVVEDAPVARAVPAARASLHRWGCSPRCRSWTAMRRALPTIPAASRRRSEVIPGCRFSPRCALVQDGCLRRAAVHAAGRRSPVGALSAAASRTGRAPWLTSPARSSRSATCQDTSRSRRRRRRRRTLHAVERRQLRHRARRDAGAGRRIRLGQDRPPAGCWSG